MIHKTLLQKHTKYFDKMLATETGKKGLVFLNEENPAAFKLFVDWIYRGLSPSPQRYKILADVERHLRQGSNHVLCQAHARPGRMCTSRGRSPQEIRQP